MGAPACVPLFSPRPLPYNPDQVFVKALYSAGYTLAPKRPIQAGILRRHINQVATILVLQPGVEIMLMAKPMPEIIQWTEASLAHSRYTEVDQIRL